MTLSWAEILPHIRYDGVPVPLGDTALVTGYLKSLYDHSGQAAALFSEIVQGGKEIRIGQGPQGQPGSNEGTHIEINLTAISQLVYFNKNGVLVQEDPRLLIIHELHHYQKGPEGRDPVGGYGQGQAAYDYDGPTVRFQNLVAAELEAAGQLSGHHQVSYTSGALKTLSPFDGLQVGSTYSENEEIEVAVLNKDGTPSINLSARTSTGSILMIGGTGSDILTSAAGRDFVWGGLGSDTLDGRDGNDILRGEAGDDLLRSGEGDDTFYGGDGNDTVSFMFHSSPQVDLQLDEDAEGLRILDDGEGGSDLLINVERLQLSDGDDRVRFTTAGLEAAASQLSEIDGDIQASALGDELDLTAVTSDVVYRNDTVGSLKFSHFETIRFGAGDDQVSSTTLSEIYLGGGDDELKHAASGTRVWGEGGDDTFHLIDNVRIEDAEANDHVSYYGVFNLTGGIRWAGSVSPYAIAESLLVEYGKNKVGDLIVRDRIFGRELFIADYVGGPGAAFNKAGIYVAEAEIGFYRLFEERPAHLTLLGAYQVFLGAVMKANYGVSTWASVDPLALDLDGDGLELTGVSFGDLVFDMDGDGYGERSGWVRSDDGLLVLDANADGQVNGVGELFGGNGASGFAELATHDTNADGVINVADSVFGSLRVWRDLDQDRQVDVGELKTLAQSGINSLSVTGTAASGSNATNQILATGTFTRADGSTGTATDVGFIVDNQNTVFLGDKTISAAAATLPELKGYGTLADLRVAMTLSPTLQGVVSSNLPALGVLDLAAMRGALQPILTAWAQASPVTGRPPLLAHDDVPLLIEVVDGLETVSDFAYEYTDTATGQTWWKLASGTAVRDAGGAIIAQPTLAQVQADTHLDGAWSSLDGDVIAFFERYLGESLPLDAAPTGAAAVLGQMTEIMSGFWSVLNSMAVRLAMQEPLAASFPGLRYDVALDGFEATSARQLIPTFEAIFTEAKALGSGALARLEAWEPILNVVIGDYHQPDELLNTNGFLFSNIVAAYESTGLTVSIGSVAEALGLPADLIRTGAGAVTGGNDADLFYLSAGNQTMSGGLGPDTYVVGRNFGQDVIDELEGAGDAHSEDVLRFADIASTEVMARREGIDLIITVNGTTDEVRIKNHFDGRLPGIGGGGDLSDDTGVDYIVFADGVRWDPVNVARAVSRPEPGAQTLSGTETVDWLDGGAGDDSLSGGNAADIYVFGRGYGNDVINDGANHIYLEGSDVLVFKAGITLEDVTFRRDGASNDLIIEIVGEAGSLKLVNQFAKTYTGPFGEHWINLIESFQFDDGTGLSWNEVMDRVLAASGTTGDDTIYGYSLPDQIGGGLGNDYLSGGNENDTYRYALGDGHDVVYDDPSNISGGMTDRVVFGTGIDPGSVTIQRIVGTSDAQFTFSDGGALLIKNQFAATATGPFGLIWLDRVEQFSFDTAPGTSWNAEFVMQQALTNGKTAGADAIEGYWREDRLDGGAGDDHLTGNEESDTYVFARGYGHDTVDEGGPNPFQVTDLDRVELQAGIATSDIAFERAGSSDDLTLRIVGTEDRLTLKGQNNWFGMDTIEEVRFADGTVWTASFMRTEFIARSSTSGADTVVGFYTADTLQGGAGDDRLEGLDGADRYVFNAGDGADKIYEGYGTSYVDRLVLGSGLTTANLTVIRSTTDPDDVTLSFGSAGSIFLDEQFVRNTNGEGIEEIQFGDGTIWAKADLVAASFGATPGDDTMLGGDGADTLWGAAGNDRLEGLDGSDRYLFNSGEGNDKVYEIYDLYDVDRLVLGTGLTPANLTIIRSTTDLDDVTLSFGASGSVFLDEQFERNGNAYGLEEIQFGDGTIWTKLDLLNAYIARSQTSGNDTIYGGNDGDTISGLAGDDRLEGLDGSDRYVFNAGDGNDKVYEIYDLYSVDRLVLGTGLTPANLTIIRSTTDLDDVTLSFGAGGSVFLDEQFERNGNAYGLEEIQFGDGTVWSRLDLLNAYITRSQTSGNDTIYGGNDGDTISGLAGDDRLEGLDGSDRYVFSAGDGNDKIYEIYDLYSVDRLVLGTGLNPANLTIIRSTTDLDDVTLSFGASGSVFLDEQFERNGNAYGVEQIEFGDGTVWSKTDLRNAYLSQNQTSGNDSAAGFSTNDSLSGLAGSDTLSGLDGTDTISGGDGVDRLTGGAGADRFVYAATSDAPVNASPEIITDFSQGSDKIDLSAIDANTGVSGDQAFAFIGTAAFSNVAGQLRYATTPSGSRTIYGDVDGDGAADFQIQVTGSTNFAAGDFLL